MGRPRKVKQPDSLPVISVSSGDTVSHVTPSVENTEDKFSKIESEHQTAVDEVTDKPKRGRPRKPKIEEPDTQAIEIAQSFSVLGGMLLDVICPRMPNPIPASDDEKKLFGDALSKVILKYAPTLGGYDAELALALSAVLILTPRIVKPHAE